MNYHDYKPSDLLPEERVDTPSMELPTWLNPVEENDDNYGTLSYNRKRKMWMLKGDPAVTRMVKRLFPGSDRNRRGICYFADNWRFIGEVNWLMMRWPLAIADRDKKRWYATLDKARLQIMRREWNRVKPIHAQPSPIWFEGTLLDFQQQGLGYLLRHERGLLADEMGLGKTVQALAALSRLNSYPVLLIVPPHLITNWKSEISRFLFVPDEDGAAINPSIHVLKGLTPYQLPDADIYIVHYLLLRGWKKYLPNFDFKAVVFDEIQELRRKGTDKYSSASLIAEQSDIVYGLSGTPIYNRGGEIWNVMNIIDYQCLGDWESFTREWCSGYGREIVLKPELLGEHLRREGLMIRRTKTEVLTELPPKRRLVQEIDSDGNIFEKMMGRTYELVKKLAIIGGSDPSMSALLKEQIINEERQATGIAKAPWVASFVRGLLEGGEKVLLFAHHHAVFDIYKKEFKHYSPGYITGRQNQQQKDKSVERFKSGKTNLCCISLRAAAGLNLQEASCVVFGELDWSPAVHSQAEDRAHRIGQKDSVLCYYLVCSQGTDQDMQDALGLKVSQFVGLMGDEPNDMMDEGLALRAAQKHIDNVINRIVNGPV